MNEPYRQPLLVDLQAPDGEGRTAARAQNFTIERLSGEPGLPHAIAASSEIIVLLPKAGAEVTGDREFGLPGHAIAILPAGAYQLATAETGEIYVLATDRLEAVPLTDPANAQAYAEPDRRVRPVGDA